MRPLTRCPPFFFALADLMGMDGDETGDAMDVDKAGAGASAGAAASSAAQAGGAPGGNDVPAAAIEALTGMGFSREQAITALRR